MWSSSRRPAAWLALAALALLPGCIEHALSEKLHPEGELESLPPLPPPSEGAIWRGATSSGSFLYFDRKARGLGDLVTVVLLESLSAEGSAATVLGKESGWSATVASDVGVVDLIQAGATQLLRWLGVVPSSTASGTSVNVIDATQTSDFDGDGKTNRSGRFQGVVTCRVMEVLPGGVYRLYGRRELVVNHELQMVTVRGLVRRADIGIDNRVASTQLAEAELTYDGLGVIDDKQRPPLLARVMDWVFPF